MQLVKVVSVDFQKDFSAEDGLWYRNRPCVDFIKESLVPHFRECGFKVAEIISDYRLPRPNAGFEYCIPGQAGYESEIPEDVKYPRVWVKSMNSPIWVRENGGVAGKPARLPFPDPAAFTEWLRTTLGTPKDTREVVLIGLTLDRCVLCTAQELYFRGYRVRFLVEAVDTFSGSQKEKQAILKLPLGNWGQPISWAEFRESIG